MFLTLPSCTVITLNVLHVTLADLSKYLGLVLSLKNQNQPSMQENQIKRIESNY